MNRAALLLFAVSVGVGLSGAATPVGVAPGRQAIDSAMTQLADVTGFTLRRQVAFELITRDQVIRLMDRPTW